MKGEAYLRSLVALNRSFTERVSAGMREISVYAREGTEATQGRIDDLVEAIGDEFNVNCYATAKAIVVTPAVSQAAHPPAILITFNLGQSVLSSAKCAHITSHCMIQMFEGNDVATPNMAAIRKAVTHRVETKSPMLLH